ncbi:MAG: CaiB/BaiF CoA transferase family protein [Alphaproteobacteria bacterium]
MTANAPPLAGLRVLDLSRVLAGPWCTMTLADLGAEVWKIENPDGGDDTRKWGPPFVAGESAYFLAINRNKKGLALDLRNPEAQKVVRDLAAKADVLVENYRTGALAKYGLDWPTLQAINPRLVYCSISAYGRSSPMADRPGYDFVVQAEGGLMAITGAPDGEPMKVGVAICDVLAGKDATAAVLAALIARERTGRGQHIDVALLDATVAALVNVASAWLVSREAPQRYGNAHQTTVPYQIFPTGDGMIALACGNDLQFAALCRRALDRPDLVDDPRFARNVERVRHRSVIVPLLTGIFRSNTTRHWFDRLLAAGVPAGIVREVPDVLTAPEVRARGMVVTVDHPTAGPLEIVASALRLSDTPVIAPAPPPTLGQHTESVLADVLGLDANAIEGLRAAGAIGRAVL